LETYVALLRGVNVGGRNKLPMKDLAAMFERLGCTNVRAYVQSGNVVFDAPERALATIPARIAAAVRERFGHAPETIVRSREDLRSVIDGNPFVARGADLARLQVMFLAQRPSPERAASLDPDRSPGDEYVLAGRELYLYQPGGIAESKLTNAYFDAKLKTTSTGRSWRTVLAIADLMDAKPRRTT
jgi:uncharacterized protein (DUF1697 family)